MRKWTYHIILNKASIYDLDEYKSFRVFISEISYNFFIFLTFQLFGFINILSSPILFSNGGNFVINSYFCSLKGTYVENSWLSLKFWSHQYNFSDVHFLILECMKDGSHTSLKITPTSMMRESCALLPVENTPFLNGRIIWHGLEN